MGLMDTLRQYANPAAAVDSQATTEHFDQVARSAPSDVVGQGVADAFKSDNTPPFGEMVGQLFGRSTPQQQAGAVNQMLGSIGPGALAALGGGILGRMFGKSDGAPPQLSPEQATQLTPQQVQDMATHAEQHDPGVMDKLGTFYASHPELVKTLGTAALTVALATVAKRMRA